MKRPSLSRWSLFAVALTAGAVTWGAASTAVAQWGWDGFPVYRASTAQEGEARGFADVLRAQGQNNLYNAAAAQNWEEARSMQLDNRLKNAQTYFQMRELNTVARFGTPEERAAQRERNSARRLFRYGQEGAPDRLTQAQLDPVTGQIAWPLPLQREEYKEYRQQLNTLFAHRAQVSGGLAASDYFKIQQITDEMLELLLSQIRDMPPADYLQAKRFVEALASEARNNPTA